MSAEQDWADALTIDCVVIGCERPAGQYCVNITGSKTLRDLPHWGRVLAGRVAQHFKADSPPPLDVTTAAILAAAETMPDGDTSARLRRVEAERDELREALNNLPCGDCWGLGVIPAEAFGRDADGAPERDEEAPCPEGCEIPAWLRAERNDAADDERLLAIAQAELASARTELEQLRSQLQNTNTEGAPPE